MIHLSITAQPPPQGGFWQCVKDVIASQLQAGVAIIPQCIVHRLGNDMVF